MIEKILAVVASICLLFVAVVMFNDIGKQDVTAVVNLKAGTNPNLALQEFSSFDNIEAVRKVDKSETKLEIIFRTRKSASQLLEMLKKNTSVEKAELSNLFGITHK
jgi:hypothetical protein